MKRIITLILLLNSACTLDQNTLKRANEICENKSGLYSVELGIGQVTIYCKNGNYINLY